jgi:hypothetical protein
MAKGSVTGTAASVIMLAADYYRDEVFIQKTNTTVIALGIGEDAETGKGIQLVNVNDTVRLCGAAARNAIYIIGSGGTATYQTGYKVDFHAGPYIEA